MARYKPLSKDLHWVIVCMYQKCGASVNDIELDTGVNKRTVQRILKLFQTTGEVIVKKAETKRAGKLNADNMDVVITYAQFSYIYFIPSLWTLSLNIPWTPTLMRCKRN
jgi:transposase